MIRAELFRPTVKDVDYLVEVEKLAWSTPGENISACREKLLARVESHGGSQSVVLATIEKKPTGSQYAFRFNWDKNINGLCSWDEYTAEGWTNKIHSPLGNTGFLVGVGVVPEFRARAARAVDSAPASLEEGPPEASVVGGAVGAGSC